MDVIHTFSAREEAGLNDAVYEFNARVADDAKLTPEAFATKEFGVLAKTWGERIPETVPLGDWLQRWTPEEQAGALAVAAGNDQLRGLWLVLLNTPQVDREDPRLAPGVEAMCGALESIGVIAAGEAATRAAAILAY